MTMSPQLVPRVMTEPDGKLELTLGAAANFCGVAALGVASVQPSTNVDEVSATGADEESSLRKMLNRTQPPNEMTIAATTTIAVMR